MRGLGRGCSDSSESLEGQEALVGGSWRGREGLGRVGACLLAAIQSLDFILRTVGNHGKNLSKGVK